MQIKLLRMIIVLSISSTLFAQIPNSGFESWTNGNPDSWFTNNVQGFISVVTQSNVSHSGASAARLQVGSFGGFPYLPQMWSGDEAFNGFPANQRYGSLTGYYQFSPVGNDGLFFIVYMKKNGEIIGGGALNIFSATSSYSQFVVPIDYSSSENPDTALIWIIAGGDSNSQGGNVGTFALIDDLAWGAVVGIEEISSNIPLNFEVTQNYPNPFNPSTLIEYSLPEESFVELKVYDVLGNEVATLVNEYHRAGKFKVDFNASGFSSGIYIARMNAGKFSKSLKMTLMK
jgi:hypothetical protein